MENTRLFNIFFDGKIKEGESLHDVKLRLSTLFKVNVEAIEKVFLDAPTIIQRGLPQEKVLKYKEIFERTGAYCRIEPQTVENPVTPPPVPPSPPTQPQTVYNPPEKVKREAVSAPIINDVETGVYHIDKEAWKALTIGSVITVIAVIFPFLSFVFRYINTLVHEIGHAIFGWLYGYPSVPAFDFNYGGGITMHQDRRLFIVFIVYFLFALLFYLYRRNYFTLILLAVIVFLYSVSAFTAWHSLIILFMGHGTELIFGSIFFYRALSGSAVIVEAERPLYAFLGFFIYFIDIRFAHRLMTSSAYRTEYEMAKGGGHWMDFSRIAEEFLSIPLSTVASFFLLLCLIAPVLTFLFFRYREYIFNFFNRALALNPEK